MNQNHPSSTTLPVATPADQVQPAEPTSTNPERLKLTNKIFTTLEAAIGTRLAQLWEGTNRAAVSDLWTRSLGEFLPEDIGAACKAFIDSGDDWPPGLPRFKAMCAVAKQRREAEIARHRQGQLALTSHNSSEQQAQVAAASENLREHQQKSPAALGIHWAETAVQKHEDGSKRLSPDALKIAREALARYRAWQKPMEPADPARVVDPPMPAPAWPAEQSEQVSP